MQSHSSSYSVEQVELIRRLRNSGITCQQLIDAFKALERIDATFGNTFNTPVYSSLQHTGTVSSRTHDPGNSLGYSSSTSFNEAISSKSSLAAANSLPQKVSELAATVGGSNTRLQTISGTFPHPSPHVSVLSVPSFANAARDKSPKFDSTYHSGPSGSSERVHNNTVQNTIPFIAGHTISQAADLTPEQCLILLQCSSEDKVIEFVKKCLSSADLKPLQQIQKLDVSESAMQAFLQGDLFSMEPTVCQKLLSWIINSCHQTEWFTLEMAKLIDFQDYGDGSEFQFSPRRERFTFRERHLDVLEAFWRKKQYPTFEEKEQIAEECNCAMTIQIQRPLGEKEKVSHVNVANWFKNKRKEIKRVTKKGETRGEPVKTFLDRLNPKYTLSVAAISSGGEDKREQTFLHNQKMLQYQREKLLPSSLSSDTMMCSSPATSDHSNTALGATSTVCSSSTSGSEGAVQQVVISSSDFLPSYPVLDSNSGFTHSAAVASSGNLVSNQSENFLESVDHLSPDTNIATHCDKASDSTPEGALYPTSVRNSEIADVSDMNVAEVVTIKQEL